MRARLASIVIDRGGLLGLAVAAVYVWLAPPHVVDGDNAELATLSATGGAAHPSGYPLYVLYLRAMAWLPAAGPAHAAAIATALLGAASVVVLHAAARAWGARAGAAAIACAVVASGPVVLRLYSQAEVFALNGLAVAAILWLAAPDGPVRGARRVVLLGLTAGLGLANHLSCALIAPIGLYGAIRGLREHRGRRWAIAAAGAGALVAGLAPYAYLIAAPDGGLAWGRIDSAAALLAHVLREDYGGASSFAAQGAHVSWLDGEGALAFDLGRGALWAPALIGVATLAVRAARGPGRAAWLCLAGSFALAGPLLVLAFDVPHTAVGRYVVARFHILPLVLLAVPIAVGLDRIAAAVGRRLDGRAAPAAAPGLLAGLALAVLAAGTAASLGHVRAGHSPAVDRALANLLGSLPPGAVVITQGDHYYFGLGYKQIVEGARPDVVAIDRSMLLYGWYRERIAARLGFALFPPGDRPAAPSVRLAETVAAHGRPVFADIDQRAIVGSLASHPHGLVVRVVPRGERMPPIEDVLARNRELYLRFDLGYRRPAPADDWAALVHQRYAATWQILARALAGQGRADDAAVAEAYARELAPR